MFTCAQIFHFFVPVWQWPSLDTGHVNGILHRCVYIADVCQALATFFGHVSSAFNKSQYLLLYSAEWPVCVQQLWMRAKHELLPEQNKHHSSLAAGCCVNFKCMLEIINFHLPHIHSILWFCKYKLKTDCEWQQNKNSKMGGKECDFTLSKVGWSGVSTLKEITAVTV